MSRHTVVRQRLFALALSVLLVTAAVPIGPLGTASAAGNVSDPALVYVQESTGDLTVVASDGTKVDTGVTGGTDIKAIGPSVDYDDDGTLEIPFVKTDGSNGPSLRVVDIATGTETTLVADTKNQFGKLAVGDFDQDGNPDIFYTTANSGVGRVDADTEPTQLVSSDSDYDAKPKAYLGSVDATGDGVRDVIWFDTSSAVKYLNRSDPDDIEALTFSTTPGSNFNTGIGEPVDFDGDGDVRAPVIDGSTNPRLLDPRGSNDLQLTGDQPGIKTTVGTADVVGDTRPELLFLDGNSVVNYIETDTNDAPYGVLTIDGNSYDAAEEPGIATGKTSVTDRLESLGGGDSTPPSDPASTTPSDGETGVSVETDISLTFGEDVRPGSGDIVLKRASDDQTIETLAASSGDVTASGKTVTATLSTTLSDQTKYYVTVDDGAIEDTAGNAYAGFSDPSTLDFTTADATAPTVSGGSVPASNGYVEVTFDEGVYANSDGTGGLEAGDLALSVSDSDGSGGTISLDSVTDTNGNSLTGGESTVRVQLGIGGTASGDETVEVTPADGSSVYDAAGNAAGSGETTGTLSLTDRQAPTVDGSSVTLGNDGSGNLAFSFETDERLGDADSAISVSVDGPSTTDVYTFDGSAFTESGTGPYTYTLSATQAYGDGDGTYTAVVDDAVDAAGNDGADGSQTDSYTLDTTAPTVSGGSVTTDNSYVEVTFDEGVYANGDGTGGIEAGDVSLSVSDSDGSAGTISVDSVTNTNGNAPTGGESTVRVQLGIGGTVSGDETVEVTPTDGTSIYDAAGNALGSSETTGTLSLTDQQAPSDPTSTTPSDGATGVSVETDVSLTFGEDVQPGTGDIVLKRASDDTAVETLAAGSGDVIASGKTVTATLSTTLSGQTEYYVTADSGAIEDTAGNAYSGFSDATTLDFTTEDATAPTISDGSVAADNSGVTVTFSEGVYADSDGTGGLSADDLSATLTQNGGTATDVSIASVTKTDGTDTAGGESTVDVQLSVTNAPASGDETVEITPVDGSSVHDAAGNALRTGETTGALSLNDRRAPSDPTSTTPADDETGTSVETDISLTFDEDIQPGSGDIVLKRAGDDSTVETLAVGSGAVTVDGQTVTATPSTLSEETAYYVTVDAGAIEDTAGNAYSGFSDSSTLSFTTADTTPPTISDGSVAADNSEVTVTFSEGVYANSDGTGGLSADDVSATLTQNGGSVTEVTLTGVTATDGSATAGGETELSVALAVTNAPASGNETVEITPADGSSVYDAAGNALGAGETTGALSLNDRRAPSDPTSTTPADGEAGVSVETDLSLTFDETVQAGSGVVSLTRASDGRVVETAAVTGSQVSISGQTVTVEPSTTLDSETDYYVTVESGAIEDTAGNAYGGFSDATTLDFTTEDADAPTVQSDSLSLQRSANGTVALRFETDERLGTGPSALTVSLDGPTAGTDWQTFDRTAFTERSAGSAYVYELTATQPYDDGDGTYAATVDTVTDGAGNTAQPGQSDEYVRDTTAPTVSGFSVSNPGNRTVEVSFTTDEQLSELVVDIGGTGSGTLSLADADVTETDGSFRYELSDTGSVDGTYTAQVDTAADAAGNDGATEQSDGVRVLTGTPTVPADTFTVERAGGDSVVVSFVADRTLSTVTVPVTGDTNRTLDRAAFTQSRTAAGNYSYRAEVSNATAGLYRARLDRAVGPDGRDGASSQQDTTSITATPTANRTTVDIGDTVRLTASPTVPEQFGPTYEWDTDADGQPEATGQAVTTTVTERGTRAVTLTVDAAGRQSTATTQLSVVDADAPTAALAGGDTVVGVGTTVTFDASASTDDVGVSQVAWDFDGDGTTDATGQGATYAYGSPGTYDATVTVTDAAGNTDVATRTITVLDPSLAGLPETLSFGTVETGTTTTRTVTLRNDGPVPVSFDAALVGSGTGAFGLGSNTSGVLSSGESVPLSLSFAPRSTGSVTRTLAVRTNGSGGPTGVTLEGTGTASTLVSNSTTLQFGSIDVGESTTAAVTVATNGNRTVRLGNVSVTGRSAGAFTVTDAPATVPANGSATVTVQYAPTAAGQDSARLDLQSGATAAGSATVALSGTGETSAVAVDTRRVEYGSVPPGERQVLSVTVRNLARSTRPLSVTDTPIVGDDPAAFAVVDGGAPVTVAPGQRHTVDVAFTPQSAGTRQAQLLVGSDGTNAAQISVWLTNTGSEIVVQELAARRAPGAAVSVDADNVTTNRSLSVNVSQPATRGRPVTLQRLSMGVAGAQSFRMNATHTDTPTKAPQYEAAPDREVLHYVGINHSVDADSVYEDTRLTYRIDRSALPAGAAPETARLHRWNGTAWNFSATGTLVRRTPDHYVYRVDTPGFSQFAVTVPTAVDDPAPAPSGGSAPDTEPTADLDIEWAETNATTVTSGDPVAVDATVTNTGSAPAETTVPIVVDGTVVDSWNVSVGPGQSTLLSTAVSFPTGTHSVSVGDTPAGSVTVGQQTATTTPGQGSADTPEQQPTTVVSTPTPDPATTADPTATPRRTTRTSATAGTLPVGPLVAVVALLAVLLGVLWRRRDDESESTRE